MKEIQRIGTFKRWFKKLRDTITQEVDIAKAKELATIPLEEEEENDGNSR
jgi:hypothetical protein